jgi:hypothetical protein
MAIKGEIEKGIRASALVGSRTRHKRCEGKAGISLRDAIDADYPELSSML